MKVNMLEKGTVWVLSEGCELLHARRVNCWGQIPMGVEADRHRTLVSTTVHTWGNGT